MIPSLLVEPGRPQMRECMVKEEANVRSRKRWKMVHGKRENNANITKYIVCVAVFICIVQRVQKY